MNFDSTDKERIREEVRTFLQANADDELLGRRFTWPVDGTFYRAYCRWRGDNFDGEDVGILRTVAEEMDLAGIELTPFSQTILVGATLSVVGSDYQKETILPQVLNGEILCALGYTEPDSGSDVAAATTGAQRDGDEWVINGQKIFTSQAEVATHIFLLTRTNPDVPKHKGLTLFLVPVDTPGVEVRELYTLAPHPTCVTFYTDVRVSDEMRVGAIDEGWPTMRVALEFEHYGTGKTTVPVPPMAPSATLINNVHDNAVEWARQTRRLDGTRVMDDPSVRSRLARIAIDHEVTRLLDYRNDPALAEPGTGNGTKLFGTEAYVRATSALMDIAGAEGLIAQSEPTTVARGWIDYAFRDAPVRTIGGGSSEIMRDAIAERRLGLPRNRGK
jgi:alkylation response protein AidB-like acyl-CoA dehydrogenase